MAQMEQMEQREGNTDSSRLMNDKYCFTFNNYTEEQMDQLMDTFMGTARYAVVGKEVGEGGTPHLQGCCRFIKRYRITQLKKLFDTKIHWEVMKGAEWQAIAYCKKDGNVTQYIDDNYDLPKKPKTAQKLPLNIITNLKPWQKSIENDINSIPDDRTINVVYCPKGNQGKTTLTKYLYVKNRCIVATGGKAEDLACILALRQEEGFDLNEKFTFILNVPRELSMSKISYKAIESIKDGLFTSPKYKSSTMIFNCPHVWIMCNELPDTTKLSSDRWKIYMINDNDELVPYVEPCYIEEKVID